MSQIATLTTHESSESTPVNRPFLKLMLFEAAYRRPDTPQPSLREGLANPAIDKLLDGWGRAGDLAVIAHRKVNVPFGAAWLRFWTESNTPTDSSTNRFLNWASALRQSTANKESATRSSEN